MLLLGVESTSAQIVTDGTVGPDAALAGPDFVIDAGLGSQAGGNLFHSFDIFNVGVGESATFSGPAGISNVIARITGMSPSFIDGVLATDFPGAPDLWMINPFGFVFGETAVLEVQGSFHVTTAGVLELADGGRFDASDAGMSTLTSAPPVAFGFLGLPAPIIVEGARLEVPAGETLSLVGGDLTIDEAFLVARSGTVLLGSLGGPGSAELTAEGLDVSGFSELGRVEISLEGQPPIDIIDTPGGDQTFIPVGNLDVSGPDGGAIWIAGGELISNGAFINGISFGSGAVINIDMSGEIRFSGDTLVQIDSIGGTSGDISINGQRIIAEGNTQIVANTQADGEGGDILLEADEIIMGDVAAVASTTAGAGNAGDITVEAGSMTMSDLSAIRADTVAGGDAGNIIVHVDQDLRMSGGAAITTAALAGSSGDGGVIDVTATTVFMSGEDTVISSNTLGEGRGGDISVTADQLTLLDQAAISSISESVGNAGDIDLIIAGRIEVFDAFITTEAESADGGNIDIVAGDRLRLRDAEITTSVGTGEGNGGNITLADPTFVILDNGRIQANAFGGAGGNISIGAEFLVVTPDSTVEASSELGVDGEISVEAPEADLVSSVTMPRTEFMEAEDLSAQACRRERRGQSSLSIDNAARSRSSSTPGCAVQAGVTVTNPR